MRRAFHFIVFINLWLLCSCISPQLVITSLSPNSKKSTVQSNHKNPTTNVNLKPSDKSPKYINEASEPVKSPINLVSMKVSTVAGSHKIGYQDGLSNQAKFKWPLWIRFDEQNNLYITENSRIRKLSKEGIVSTLTGNGENEFIDGQMTTKHQFT